MIKLRADVADVEPGAGFLLGATIPLEIGLNTLIPKNYLCFTNSTAGRSEVTGTGGRATSHGQELKAHVWLDWCLWPHLYYLHLWVRQQTVLSLPAHLTNTLKFDFLQWWGLALLESRTQSSICMFMIILFKKTLLNHLRFEKLSNLMVIWDWNWIFNSGSLV